MNIYVPNYYSKFRCIADKCRHSCCIGWEIDIDSDTLSYYNTLDGYIADRLKSAISHEGAPHFVLTKGDRCPFLNQNGLCDLICTLGEDSLCNICADHPRFRNFYSNSVEMGLGLCCEAAADLILNTVEPFELLRTEGKGDFEFDEQETYVLNTRHKFIETTKDRTKTVEERHRMLLKEIDGNIPSRHLLDWCNFFLGLERLDNEWTDVLTRAKNAGLKSFYPLDKLEYQTHLEQLTVYFLYRHMPSAIYDGDIASGVKFAIFSTGFIYTLANIISSIYQKAAEGFNDNLLNIARMYSAEIEYSDENLEKIFDELY